MSPATSLTAADRFALIIDGLCRAVAARGGERSANGPNLGPLIVLIWTWLRRVAARFAVLAARVRSGLLPSPARAHRSAQRESPPRPANSPTLHRSASPRLPRSFGWLVRLVPGTAVTCCRSQLLHLLSDPEMSALLSDAPQIERMLRPLCRMLAIRVPKSRNSIARAQCEPESAIRGPDRLAPTSGNIGSPPRPNALSQAPPNAPAPERPSGSLAALDLAPFGPPA